jgi:hypothetical protein
MRTHQLAQNFIEPGDLDLFQVTDDVEWAANYLAQWHEQHMAGQETAPEAPAAWQTVTAEGTTTGKSPRKEVKPKGYEDLLR